MQENEKYDFSTKESQYLLKTFSDKLYKVLDYIESKDIVIEEQVKELTLLQAENTRLSCQVAELDAQLRAYTKVSLLEKILRKIYRICRKIAQKFYNILKRIFGKRA